MAVAVIGIGGAGALAPVTANATAPSADVSVAVSHAPSSAVTGDDITFTVVASNDGPDAATGVVAGLGFSYPLQLDVVPAGCKRAASYESVLCDLPDIASGSSATIDITLKAHGSGLFSVPAAIAADTADPDTNDLVATDTLLVKAGPSQAVRYITGIFPIIVDRPVDAASLTYWAARWKAENNRYPRKLESVPGGIINSNEYRRLRIREAYQRILGRPVDAPSLTYWVNKAAKGWSYEAIERTLLTSKEFLGKNDHDAIPATYLAVLGQTSVSPTLEQYWFGMLSTPGFTRADFVRRLQASTEGYDVVIKRFYQDTLGHDPSPLGRYVWQVRLREGKSPEALWSQLLVSNELLQKYPYTDDDYTDGPVFDPPTRAVSPDRVQAALAAN